MSESMGENISESVGDFVGIGRQLLERQFSTLRTVLLDSLIEVSSSEEQIMKTVEGRHLSEELIAASRIYVTEALKNKRD